MPKKGTQGDSGPNQSCKADSTGTGAGRLREGLLLFSMGLAGFFQRPDAVLDIRPCFL